MSTPSPPRRRIVGVSTKMYFSFAQTTTYTDALLSHLSTNPSLLNTLDVFILPDLVSLTTVISKLSAFSSQHAGAPVLTGAQHAHSADHGAFTGEVSPSVLAEVGARILEIGHAERRRLFHETDASAAERAAAAARNGLVPLVCVGERTRGSPDVAVAECAPQIASVVAAIPPDTELVLAYEPVWAIGAAEPADATHVVAVTRAVRELPCVRDRPGQTRILYGGSAGPGLFAKLKEGVDGLFLGRFAHDPAQFWRTICEVAEA
ncbi:Triosephosphate isomerase [Xylariaceae sp. FL0016]|nr:Triosephosphate isomerase [Xylariaceae sp. FL0016]